MRLVVGCELTLWQPSRAPEPFSRLTVHVQDHTGYSNLCRILTESHKLHGRGKAKKPAGRVRRSAGSFSAPESLAKNVHAGVPLEVVCQHAAGLWAMAHAPYDASELSMLREAFGDRLSLEVHRHLDGEDSARLALAAASSSSGIPVCATNAVLFAERDFT